MIIYGYMYMVIQKCLVKLNVHFQYSQKNKKSEYPPNMFSDLRNSNKMEIFQ